MTCGCIVVLLVHPARERRATRTTRGPSGRRQRRVLAGAADRTCRSAGHRLRQGRSGSDAGRLRSIQRSAVPGVRGGSDPGRRHLHTVRGLAARTSEPGHERRVCGSGPCFFPCCEQGPHGFNCTFQSSTPGGWRAPPGTSEQWSPMSLSQLCARRSQPVAITRTGESLVLGGSFRVRMDDAGDQPGA